MELQPLPTKLHQEDNKPQQPASPPIELDQNSNDLAPTTTSTPPPPHHLPNPNAISRWWTTHISLTLPHHPPHDFRDHLALERTFLGWIRTTTVLVSLGVVVTQLFVLKDLDPTKGKVLGCLLAGAGMAIVAASAGRYFRAQALLLRVKALTGGWEAVGVWMLIGAVLVMLLLVVVIED